MGSILLSPLKSLRDTSFSSLVFVSSQRLPAASRCCCVLENWIQSFSSWAETFPSPSLSIWSTSFLCKEKKLFFNNIMCMHGLMQTGKQLSQRKYYHLLYGKPSSRQIPVLWLVLSRPIRVFLFWSKAGKLKICNQDSEKKVWKLSFFTLKLPAEAKKIEIFPKFRRWTKKTNIF